MPANTTSSVALPQTDSSFHNVSVNLTGLTAGTQYCAEIVAHNASGDSHGGQDRFTPGAPAVSTEGVQPVSATEAVTGGFVNPDGSATTYRASYDLASSAWCLSDG